MNIEVELKYLQFEREEMIWELKAWRTLALVAVICLAAAICLVIGGVL